VAQQFPLVQDGMLTDYQTTRESAAWIAPWYTKQGKAATSHGCASAEAADAVTMQHCPNIVLEPATSDISRDDLIKQVKKGIFFEAGLSLKPLHYRGKRVIGDFQGRTGIGMFPAREIVDGKLGAVITRAAFSFDTVELWKNVIEVGGKNGRKRVAMESTKGEPEQVTRHSVSAVPMAVTRVAVVDPQRKA
jgi:TldD protein